MERLERFHKIRELIRRQGAVSRAKLLEELGGPSPATFKRDLEYMRSRMHCPIVWNRSRKGYVIENDPKNPDQSYELPGLWFNASEIYALLMMQHLLKNLQPGLLDGHIGPLQERLRALLEQSNYTAKLIDQRVKVIHLGSRKIEIKHFEQIAQALLDGKRLRISYLNRDRKETTTREVSPLQLVHYRENWLLDAWCHMREAIRSFSLDAVQAVSTLPEQAKSVPKATLVKHFESGYGIFAGEATHRAHLKFTPERAQWVSLETWHSNQTSRYLPDGSYILEVPYSNDQELVMDLLRHGAEVEVLAPPALRQKVAATLVEASKKYLKKPAHRLTP